MKRAGFNTENAFFVDQVARRDISQNVENLYHEELWEIHERFLQEVWDNMTVTVVICWGSAVRKRFLGDSRRAGWFQNFEVVRIWGRFAGIELFLELSPDRKLMKRFVLFVKHPSYFFYIQSDKKCAKNLRHRHGRPQDLALEVAAKLGQIEVESHFYEWSPNLCVSLSVPHTVTEKRDGWKGEAAAQLQRAFPSAKLAKNKSHRALGPRARNREWIEETSRLMDQFSAGQVYVNAPPRNSDISSGISYAADKAQVGSRQR